MSINLELQNKCLKCKNRKGRIYMIHKNNVYYEYWCDYNKAMGEKACNNYEPKEGEKYDK